MAIIECNKSSSSRSFIDFFCRKNVQQNSCKFVSVEIGKNTQTHTDKMVSLFLRIAQHVRIAIENKTTLHHAAYYESHTVNLTQKVRKIKSLLIFFLNLINHIIPNDG
jgi:hypothetical protein